MIINLAKIRFSGASAKPEDSFQETYTANGSYDITPEKGHVFSGGHVEVDVHPTDKLTRTYTENSTYEINGEWSNAEITVAVPGPVEETFDITPTNSDITVVPTVADNVFSGGVVRGYDVDPIYNALEDLNTGDPTAPSAINFSIIGWSSEESNAWNNDINAKVAYSKTKYDEWDPSSTSAYDLYANDTQMVFAPKIDTHNVTNMQSMFYACKNLTSIPQLDTSNVTNMGSMFNNCSSLTSVPQLDTSKVVNLAFMFRDCSSLLHVPQLDTSSATGMNYMFYGCSSLTSVPQLDTSKVGNLAFMFYNCSSLTSVPQLDTSSAKNMIRMFYNCSSLQSVDGIDFSSMTFKPGYFFGDDSTDISTLTHFIVNGSINFSWDDSYGFYKTPNLDYESIKSILEACNRTTNTDPKTMKFNQTIADQNGELAGLVSACATKGWTVDGLTIN